MQELKSTSEKNRRIIDKVLPKGPEGYQIFLDLLNKSGNEFVYKLLKEKEKEIPKKGIVIRPSTLYSETGI